MFIKIERTISPAERVLMLAEELPNSRPQLYQEAERMEALLESLEDPESDFGAELTEILEEVSMLQLEGVLGLLEYDECGDCELLEESLELLLESNQSLQELENSLERAREDMPLVA